MAVFSFGSISEQLKEVQEFGLSFEDKQLKWHNAEDVKDVVSALENTKIVHYLKLEGNTLGVEAAAAIGKALEGHPEFRKALWKNMFTSRLKTEIPQALKYLGHGLIVAKAQLTVLDLSDNALGPSGMVGLEEFLRSPVCYTLEELRLNNCGLGIYGGRMLSKAILDCYNSSKAAGTPLKLKVFIAGRNRLENEGAKAIAKIFANLKTFEHISMPQNSIYHEGIHALAEGIKCNPNLTILNLNDNTITHKGAVTLADSLAYTPNLCELNLGDCLLKTNGAYCFAEALERNHFDLQDVDMGFNDIGPDGGLALVSALRNKPNLKRLYLDGNQFGFDGRERIKEISSSLAHPESLGSFDEDQSEEENEVDDDDDVYGEEEDDDDEVYGEKADQSQDDDDDEAEEEEDEVCGDEDRSFDTTKELDNNEECQDEYDDNAEDIYTTTEAFTTTFMNPNDSNLSGKSVTFSNNLILEKSNTIESFCLSTKPSTLEMFKALKEEDKKKAIEEVINQFSGDNYLLVLIFTTLKLANLSQSSKEALELAISFFKESIQYAIENKQERRVLNYILMQLGLLRSEKKFNSPYDLKSCRFALRETLKKEEISSDYMKNAFNVFLENTD